MISIGYFICDSQGFPVETIKGSWSINIIRCILHGRSVRKLRYQKHQHGTEVFMPDGGVFWTNYTD